MELINKLGYNPSYPYGSSGSGVPTQKGAGVGGNVIGGILGNLLIPGLGGIIGSKLGGMGARSLTRYFQGHGMNQQPAANNKGGGRSNQVAPAQPAADNKAGHTQAQQPGPAQQPAANNKGAGGSGGGGGGGVQWPSGSGGLGQSMDYFEPTGGWGRGDPGDYNPTGPMGRLGTAGIVNSSSPAGGGSFFGGTVNPRAWATAIGFGGNFGGSIGAGQLGGNRTAGFRRPYTAEEYARIGQNLKYPAPALTNAFGGISRRPSYEQYLRMWHPQGPRSGASGVGGGSKGFGRNAILKRTT